MLGMPMYSKVERVIRNIVQDILRCAIILKHKNQDQQDVDQKREKRGRQRLQTTKRTEATKVKFGTVLRGETGTSCKACLGIFDGVLQRYCYSDNTKYAHFLYGKFEIHTCMYNNKRLTGSGIVAATWAVNWSNGILFSPRLLHSSSVPRSSLGPRTNTDSHGSTRYIKYIYKWKRPQKEIEDKEKLVGVKWGKESKV
jgi:hypothetical protein